LIGLDIFPDLKFFMDESMVFNAFSDNSKDGSIFFESVLE